jgi:hypothetical protein
MILDTWRTLQSNFSASFRQKNTQFLSNVGADLKGKRFDEFMASLGFHGKF